MLHVALVAASGIAWRSVWVNASGIALNTASGIALVAASDPASRTTRLWKIA